MGVPEPLEQLHLDDTEPVPTQRLVEVLLILFAYLAATITRIQL